MSATSETLDRADVAGEYTCRLSSRRFPDTDRPVFAGSRHELAVGMEGNAIELETPVHVCPARVSRRLADRLACGRVPELQCAVCAARQHSTSIRVKRHGNRFARVL